MQLTSHSHQSNLRPPTTQPESIAVPKGKKSMTVDYVKPVTEEKFLGTIPGDSYTNLEMPLLSRHDGPQSVYRQQPVVDAEGRPVYKQASAELDVEPHSKTTAAVLGGLGGGTLLGMVGLGIAAAVGVAVAPIGLAGLAIGVAAGAFGGAKLVEGDEVTIEFQKRPVERHRLDGHDETVSYQYRTEGGGTYKGVSMDPDMAIYQGAPNLGTGMAGHYTPYRGHQSAGNETEKKPVVIGVHHEYSPDISLHQVNDAYYWAPQAIHSKGW